MGNKFRMSTTPVSKNCQTVYFDKEVLHVNKGLGRHKLLMTVFVYVYVILKYRVFIFLDLKQMANVYCPPFQLLCVEITGMLMIREF